MSPVPRLWLPTVRIILCVSALAGCGKTQKEQVDDLRMLLEQKRFREVLSEFNRISPGLHDPQVHTLASEIQTQALAVVQQSMKLINQADSAAAFGFAVEARDKYRQAANLEPAETTITAKLRSIPSGGRPMYRYSGSIGDREFVHTYHTRWYEGQLVPDFVEITVANNNTTRPTDLARFVPSFNYIEVTGSGPHVLIVVAEPDKYLYSKLFNEPIWRGETKTGTVTYAKARVTQENPRLSVIEIFRRIIQGNDKACFINMIGFQRVEIRGLHFIGYE